MELFILEVLPQNFAFNYFFSLYCNFAFIFAPIMAVYTIIRKA